MAERLCALVARADVATVEEDDVGLRWRLVVGWWQLVGGSWLVAVGWWRLMADGWLMAVVGGCWWLIGGSDGWMCFGDLVWFGGWDTVVLIFGGLVWSWWMGWLE